MMLGFTRHCASPGMPFSGRANRFHEMDIRASAKLFQELRMKFKLPGSSMTIKGKLIVLGLAATAGFASLVGVG
jgi:hypothetical protein